MKKFIPLLLLLFPTPTYADDLKAINCLALNIYHEGRGESIAGQKAIAEVTLNRMKHENFKPTVCGVVYQKYQFSWTIHKPKVRDQKKLDEIYELAFEQYYQYNDNNDGSVYYHSMSVNPDWSRKFQKTKIVGRHVFYKFKDDKK